MIAKADTAITATAATEELPVAGLALIAKLFDVIALHIFSVDQIAQPPAILK